MRGYRAFPAVLWIVPLLALPAMARPAPLRPKPVTQPVVLQLTGIRCSVCIQSVRQALAHFPGVLNPQFDVPREQVRLRVKPGFDQYAKLKEAVEAGGGEIKMFHAAYLVPQPLYTTLGVRDLQDDKLDRLRRRLGAVPGVRAAIIDPSRWFTNDQGLDVGGAVVFSDPDPRLEKNLERAASQAGFSLETRMDDPAAMHEQEFGVMNHRITGLLLLLLTGLGVLQITASQPPSWVRYGSLAVWLGLFVFIALRADPEYWPLGAINWLEGFKDRECCQHRLGAALLI